MLVVTGESMARKSHARGWGQVQKRPLFRINSLLIRFLLVSTLSPHGYISFDLCIVRESPMTFAYTSAQCSPIAASELESFLFQVPQ